MFLSNQVVESCKAGFRKPDPRIYELCLKELGVPAPETVFLDDLGMNLKAAKKFGIRTIKVKFKLFSCWVIFMLLLSSAE